MNGWAVFGLIIAIVIIIAVIIGIVVGIIYTGEPKEPTKCSDANKDKYEYRDANGKPACCVKKPEEWSRFRMMYTKCPT